MLRTCVVGKAALLAAALVAPVPGSAAPQPDVRVTVARPLPGGASDFGVSVLPLGDDALIAGFSESGESDAGLLLRVGPTGEEIWRRDLASGGDGAVWSLRALGDGTFAGAGWAKSPTGDLDAMLVRADAAGKVVWQTSYHGPNKERLWSLAVVPQGLLAVGEVVEASGASGAFMLRTDLEGKEIARIPVPAKAPVERAFSVQAMAGGGFVVAGLSGSGPREGAGYDARIVRCNEAGAPIWSRSWGGPGFDVAHDLRVLDDGGVLVTGYTDAGEGKGTEVFLLRLSPGGEVVWSRTYGGPGDDRAVHLDLLTGGRAAIAGYSRSGAGGDWDVVVRIVESDGAPLRVERFGGSGDEIGRSVAVTADGGLTVVGHSQSYGPRERILFLRLRLG